MLHSSREAIDRWDAFEKKYSSPRMRVLPAPYGEDLPPLKNYPLRIKDYSLYDIFGSLKKPSLTLKDRVLPSMPSLRRSIRETGKCLSFPHLGFVVYGISSGFIMIRK